MKALFRVALIVVLIACSLAAECSKECIPPNFICEEGNCTCAPLFYGTNCTQDLRIMYRVYCTLFASLFGILAIIAGIQLSVYFACEGCSLSIPKFLQFVFMALGIERVIWLSIDPHCLREKMNPVLENILFGAGDFTISVAYFLVVMLWAKTYKAATLGTSKNWILNNSTAIFTILVISFGISEVTLRVLWKLYPPGSIAYLIIIAVYNFVLVMVLVIVCGSFLVFGVRLSNNFNKFEGMNPSIKERLKRMRILIVGLTIVCFLTLCWVVASCAIELQRYHFIDTESFLIEQFGYRFWELCLSALIVYFLRYRPQPPTAPLQPIRQPSKPYDEASPLIKS